MSPAFLPLAAGTDLSGLPADPRVAGIALITALVAAGLMAGPGLAAWLFLHPPPWRARLARLRRSPWRGADGGRLVIGLLATGLAVGLAAGIWIGRSGGARDDRVALLLVAQSLAFHGAALVYIAAVIRRRRWTASEAFALPSSGGLAAAGAGALHYLAVLPLVLLIAAFWQTALRAAGFQPEMQDVLHMILARQPWILRAFLVFLAVIVAPVVEEALFRGIAFPLAARRAGAWGAALAISVLFALLHRNLGAFLPLLAISLVFHASHVATGSLIAPIVLHALFNGVNIILLMTLRPGLAE